TNRRGFLGPRRRDDEGASRIDMRRIVIGNRYAEASEVTGRLRMRDAAGYGDLTPERELGQRAHTGSGDAYEVDGSSIRRIEQRGGHSPREYKKWIGNSATRLLGYSATPPLGYSATRSFSNARILRAMSSAAFGRARSLAPRARRWSSEELSRRRRMVPSSRSTVSWICGIWTAAPARSSVTALVV